MYVHVLSKTTLPIANRQRIEKSTIQTKGDTHHAWLYLCTCV